MTDGTNVYNTTQVEKIKDWTLVSVGGNYTIPTTIHEIMVIVYAVASGGGGGNIMGMSIVPSYVINNRWNNLDNETCMLIPCSDDLRTSLKYKASNREISIQAKGSTSWFVDIFAR